MVKERAESIKESTPVKVSHSKSIRNINTNTPFHARQEQVPVEYLMQNYQRGPKYSLNHINSILFRQGKIYNLLQKNSSQRTIKCGCFKSFCEAKYCQCYRWGEACSQQCSCHGCRNLRPKKGVKKKQIDNSCNCIKSGCNKKYCECFQNGQTCGKQCKCKNCKNKI